MRTKNLKTSSVKKEKKKTKLTSIQENIFSTTHNAGRKSRSGPPSSRQETKRREGGREGGEQ